MPEARVVFLDNLSLIDRTITKVCRWNGMSPDEIEDFSQSAKLRMMENDYAVIGKYEGRSSFATFIASVVQHFLLDQRIHDWGKWHASAAATRLGDLAVELEQLLYRDKHPFEEAFQLLAQRHPGITHDEASSLAAQIPPRVPRRKVDIDEASLSAVADPSPDIACKELATRVSAVVQTVIDSRSEDDQLLLCMRFQSGMTVTQMARALNRNQQQLYSRLYAIFGDLKRELALAGITWSEVAELIGSDEGILDFNLKSRSSRPSDEDGSTVAEPEDNS